MAVAISAVTGLWLDLHGKDRLSNRVMGSLKLGVPYGQCWGSSPAATAETRSKLGSLKLRLAAKSKARKFALFYK